LLKKPATQNCQQAWTIKAYSLKPKDQERDSLAKRKLVGTPHCTLAKHHRKKVLSHPYPDQQRSSGKPKFPSLPRCIEAS